MIITTDIETGRGEIREEFTTVQTCCWVCDPYNDGKGDAMEQTLKAILARFDGDYKKAIAYCDSIVEGSTNLALRNEYSILGQRLYNDAREKETV
jgi:hypothetical protein